MLSRAAILLTVVYLAAGCASSSPEDETPHATVEWSLQVGDRTLDDIKIKLGNPAATYERGQLLVYIFRDIDEIYLPLVGLGGGDIHHMAWGEISFLIIRLDNQGKLHSIRAERAGLNTDTCSQSAFCHVGGQKVFRLANAEDDIEAKRFQPPAESCGVYLYEPGGVPPGSASISLDGEDIGFLGGWLEGWTNGGRTFFNWNLAPGEHRLVVYGTQKAGEERPSVSHSFVCHSGQILFFTYETFFRLALKGLMPVDEPKGRKQVAKRRLAVPFSERQPKSSKANPSDVKQLPAIRAFTPPKSPNTAGSRSVPAHPNCCY